MKKIFLSIALMICAVCATNAQSFNSDTRFIGAAVGLDSGAGIPVSLYYEQAVHEHIGVGAAIGYLGTEGIDHLLLGIRANYHFLEHIVEGTKWDTYGGLILGYNIATGEADGDFILGGQLGARYCFNDSWAMFAEAGYGFGVLTLGATYAF